MQHPQHLQRRQLSTFVWGFNDVTGLTLPECGTVSLYLNTTQIDQVPPAAPYSLIVYPAGGLPLVFPLTLTGTLAPWTVTYPAGTQLVFNMADANKNSGGVPPEIYTVQPGQSTGCLPPASTPVVTMKIDEPSALKTCTVLPIHIEGGQKPYTVTLATANSVAPSNKTLGSNDDTFEWVNQSAPNSQLIVAVSDSKGQYAVTSQLLMTSGSTDASCPGQSSRSYNSGNPNGGSSNSTGSNNSNNSNNSDNSNNSNNSNNNSSNSNGKLPVIIGATVGALILLGLLLFVFSRRKNKVRGRRGVGLWERKLYHRPTLDPVTSHNLGGPVHQDHTQPTPFVLPGTQPNAALAYYGESSKSSSQNMSLQPTAPTERGHFSQQSGFGYPPPSSSSVAPSVHPPSTYQDARTSTAQRMSYYDPVTPQGTSTAPRASVYNDGVSRYSTYTVQNPALLQGGEGSASANGAAASQKTAEAQRERGDPSWSQPLPPIGGDPLVYQHQDAGDVVELPPAYREYSQTSAAPPPP